MTSPDQPELGRFTPEQFEAMSHGIAPTSSLGIARGLRAVLDEICSSHDAGESKYGKWEDWILDCDVPAKDLPRLVEIFQKAAVQ